MGGAVHGRRWRAPKTPILPDVLWVRGRLKLQNQERSLPRVLNSNPTSYSVIDTRIVGGGIMSKRNLVIEEGSVEAMASLPPVRPHGARGRFSLVPKCAFSGCGGKAVRWRDCFDPISEVANGLATTERARQGARRMGQPVPVTKGSNPPNRDCGQGGCGE